MPEKLRDKKILYGLLLFFFLVVIPLVSYALLKDKFKVTLKHFNMQNNFSRTCTCKTAKEIWDELEKTYEGTSRVRDTKISLLCGEFENFKMESNETIDEMHNRFINIINPLSVLGKTFSNVEINSKILRSLPRE